MAAERPPLSVMVATIRGWPTTRMPIEALRPQVEAIGGEILVMDGSDRPAPTADEVGPSVHWVKRPGQIGVPAQARRISARSGGRGRHHRGSLPAGRGFLRRDSPGPCRQPRRHRSRRLRRERHDGPSGRLGGVPGRPGTLGFLLSTTGQPSGSPAWRRSPTNATCSIGCPTTATSGPWSCSTPRRCVGTARRSSTTIGSGSLITSPSASPGRECSSTTAAGRSAACVGARWNAATGFGSSDSRSCRSTDRSGRSGSRWAGTFRARTRRVDPADPVPPVLDGGGRASGLSHRAGRQPAPPLLGAFLPVGIARADTAIVHDYFLKDGGAEQVALEPARMFPDAPVYTSLFDEERLGSCCPRGGSGHGRSSTSSARRPISGGCCPCTSPTSPPCGSRPSDS